jgi:hypothetical protein
VVAPPWLQCTRWWPSVHRARETELVCFRGRKLGAGGVSQGVIADESWVEAARLYSSQSHRIGAASGLVDLRTVGLAASVRRPRVDQRLTWILGGFQADIYTPARSSASRANRRYPETEPSPARPNAAAVTRACRSVPVVWRIWRGLNDSIRNWRATLRQI